MDIMIVEDNRSQRLRLRAELEELQHNVREAEDGIAALAKIKSQPPDVLITDWVMPKLTGPDLVREVRRLSFGSDIYILILTVQDKIEHLREGMAAGAEGFLTKPYVGEQLEAQLRLAKRFLRYSQQAHRNEQSAKSGAPADPFVFRSEQFRAVLEQAKLVAPEPASVLLTGETGTGKELLARYIHDLSDRTGLFVPVNCAAISDDLFGSEFFGHEKGAFTGADRRKLGLFELAEGGTLFLDEVGDLTPRGQTALLRVLQDLKIWRVGGSTEIPVNVRIVSASNTVKKYLEDGLFREDLYQRLNGFDFPPIPSLRERRADIDALIDWFVKKESLPPLSAEAGAVVRRYPWPGNVRELLNALNSARIRARNNGGAIGIEHLPQWLTCSIREQAPPGTERTSPPAPPATAIPTAGEPFPREPLLGGFCEDLDELQQGVITLDGFTDAIADRIILSVSQLPQTNDEKARLLGLSTDQYARKLTAARRRQQL